jgi:2-keto-3-deoxy-L-rhamnonate aldolase RhmA
MQWGLGMQEYLALANEETLVIPLIETREAIENIEEVLEVPGLEAIFFGPADLSASYGYLGEWEGPGVADRIVAAKDRAATRGIAAGLLSRGSEDANRRRDQGFRMIGLGADTGLLIQAAERFLDAVGRPVQPRRWF